MTCYDINLYNIYIHRQVIIKTMKKFSQQCSHDDFGTIRSPEYKFYS